MGTIHRNTSQKCATCTHAHESMSGCTIAHGPKCGPNERRPAGSVAFARRSERRDEEYW